MIYRHCRLCGGEIEQKLEESHFMECVKNPYPLSDWQYEVVCGNTKLGYYEWREHQEEADNGKTSNPET